MPPTTRKNAATKKATGASKTGVVQASVTRVPSSRRSSSRESTAPGASSSPAARTARNSDSDTESRGRGLTVLQKAQLHVDIVRNKGCLFKDLLNLKRDYYGGPDRSKFEYRFDYLQNTIKKEDPSTYWDLWRKAKAHIEEENSSRPPEEDEDDDDDEEEVTPKPPPPSTPIKRAPPQTPPTSKKTRSIQKNPCKMSDDYSIGGSTITSRASLFASPSVSGNSKIAVLFI